MGKDLFIAEKPSVAKEFAKVLGVSGNAGNGYLESGEFVVTWCVGHLVTMSYPDAYDPALKKWSLQTLPFLPEKFLYELIPDVKKQFQVVAGLLNREDVTRIYVCTDSGREGEYIYRLVDQMANVPKTKEKRRVWIDSQTEEEIRRGIAQAKLLEEYDNLSDSAYLRAKEDYLMGINFSRVLSLKYGRTVMDYLNNGKWTAISVGRVMTCVLGMVVRREREIRNFVKTPFYRVIGGFSYSGQFFEGEWKVTEQSKYYRSPALYKENGFKEKKDALELCSFLGFLEPMPEKDGQDAFKSPGAKAVVTKAERKKEKKNPPLLFNLAELQNTSSKLFKISPDETLKIVQELYEKKLVTYPRTDARVLSTAVSKEIQKNIRGLCQYPVVSEIAAGILEKKSFQGLSKTRYVNDKQITDHYAIIPTGQGLGALNSVSLTAKRVYEVIVRRFLCIFYPPAEYLKLGIVAECKKESFFAGFKVMVNPGYLEIASASFAGKKAGEERAFRADGTAEGQENAVDQSSLSVLQGLKKGMELDFLSTAVKEGETSPPKRYNSGSMILAMENAGQLIEDEDLRSQIKGSGIGTSATRAEILSKLVKIKYLNLNKNTQVITPELLGEMVYDVVSTSIRPLLNPELTASWELGLTQVAEGTITTEEYMEKLNGFITRRVQAVRQTNNQVMLHQMFDQAAVYYKKTKEKPKKAKAAPKREVIT
ncbi:type IA DNA topoisomerase [bacterium D16-51]|nr:type IA DNA topoisomerase [bacterium D16-59]RKI61077.1 type IA DNA topoisomerase [bacterium D16-51]